MTGKKKKKKREIHVGKATANGWIGLMVILVQPAVSLALSPLGRGLSEAPFSKA